MQSTHVDRLEAYPTMLRHKRPNLSANAWWIIGKEIAWTTIGVVRVSCLRCSHAGPHVWIGTVLAMRKVSTVVGTASLPTNVAWTASNWTVAAIAAIVVKAATGHGKGYSK